VARLPDHPGGGVPLGGVILGQRGIDTRPTEEKVAEMLRAAMTKQGMVCAGCRRVIEGGFEFIGFFLNEQGGLETRRSFACARDDCGYAQKVAEEAHVMRRVEWAFLRPVELLGDEKPPG
jgi:hypothetical protein